jgi:hypothetical protein
MLAAMALAAAQFPVRHEHFRKYCEGTLTVDEKGVTFAGGRGHAWTWPLVEIQQLTVSPESVTVLTYEDRKFKLGDRRFVFTGKAPASELAAMLREAMGPKLVAAVAEPDEGSWSIPAKHLQAGSQGVLWFGEKTVVYASKAPGESRTWRLADIRTISSADPYELTVVTMEKTFHFQLKEALEEKKYESVWMAVAFR